MKFRVMITACIFLLLLLTSALADTNGKGNALTGGQGDALRKGAFSGSQSRHLDADDSLRDLLGHPAFAGFARLLLPWDDRRYDETMRLSDIGSLLPYHSHVDPKTVVGALNRMIDDVIFRERDVFSGERGSRRRRPRLVRCQSLVFCRRRDAPSYEVVPGYGAEQDIPHDR